jgi:hypothetical protein
MSSLTMNLREMQQKNDKSLLAIETCLVRIVIISIQHNKLPYFSVMRVYKIKCGTVQIFGDNYIKSKPDSGGN